MKSQKSYASKDHGKLYLVPTPIGNLEDMTFRSVRILKEADLIAAEDTRLTQKLLNHFGVETPQISFHEHNWKERVPEMVQRLKDGVTIAQVSDAGMPSISDPGYELTKAAIEADLDVIPLPGPSAGVTALIASGLKPQPFYFYGFLPRKKSEQDDEIKALNEHEETIILYESPHRLKQTLRNLLNGLGNDRKVVLARELTKKYEEFLRGNLKEAVEWAENSEIRGEFSILLEGNSQKSVPEEQSWISLTVRQHVEQLMKEQDWSSKEAIKEVAKLRKMKKQDVYAVYHDL